MASKVVECLNCGMQRRVAVQESRPTQANECGRCGYVGWAESEALDETLRRELREQTVEQRRHTAPW